MSRWPLVCRLLHSLRALKYRRDEVCTKIRLVHQSDGSLAGCEGLRSSLGPNGHRDND